MNISSNIVRTRRLELPRPNGHQPLKLARLPIPPRAHYILIIGPKIKQMLNLFCFGWYPKHIQKNFRAANIKNQLF